ncbi:MAG TPA: PIN domain-containing protein [Caulobacteraceae bacterium]|nr:PIN domain-containing protein [Caulobacteraceae bacterium]
MRATVDSDVLIYAELEPESEKGSHAQAAINLAAPRGILAIQALLEFLAVVRRRKPERIESAYAKVFAWSEVFVTAPTTDSVVSLSASLVRRHRFQIWDAVIWAAARAAGAEVILSEDLQHGLSLEGMRAINPFRLENEELADLLA